VDKVVTIEVSPRLNRLNKQVYADCRNIDFLLGASEDVLPAILPKLQGDVLYWLDGHFSAGITGMSDTETPIIKEINAIGKHNHKGKVVLMVDDIRCFDGTHDYPTLDVPFHARWRHFAAGGFDRWGTLDQADRWPDPAARARAAFDLSQEPESVRERYGKNRFGQCCLLARRLVEAGVRFVTVNTFLTVFDEITWDIHGTAPFTSIEGMKNIVAPMYDQAYSALIGDLVERGLLDNTLVCNVAEFGRTPRVNPAGGRDHWPQCWTVYFAGGGVKGGRVVGRSDPVGAYPAERPVNPGEIVGTVFHSLGFDLESHLPGPAGRPFPLVDFGTKHIHELFA
jgi:hypothetical protein